jgi:nucleoside-triphosphatase
VVEGLGRSTRAAGFYTREIRRQGARLGFEAIGLGGGSCVLAHVDSRSKIRVGRYGVELAAFESLLRAELERPLQQIDLVVIDEIGKMECSSRVFVQLARGILDGPVPVLATIATKGGGFIAEVKGRADVQLIRVSAANRDQLVGELLARF